MNKIKNLLKGSPIAMVVAGLVIAGVASAALLAYYGRITGEVRVKQSVVLDGYPVNRVTDEVRGSAGDIIYGREHY